MTRAPRELALAVSQADQFMLAPPPAKLPPPPPPCVHIIIGCFNRGLLRARAPRGFSSRALVYLWRVNVSLHLLVEDGRLGGACRESLRSVGCRVWPGSWACFLRGIDLGMYYRNYLVLGDSFELLVVGRSRVKSGGYESLWI